MPKINSWLQATVWAGLGQYFTQIVTLLGLVVLARVLQPESFGQIAILQAIGAFFSMFTIVGFSSAVVQFGDLNKRDVGSLLSLALLVGAISAIIFAAASPLIAHFFTDGDLLILGLVYSLNLVAIALQQVPRGLLERASDFRRRSVAMVLGSLLSMIAAIGLALSGAEAWALVGSMLVMNFSTMVFFFYFAKLGLKLRWDKRVIDRSFRFISEVSIYQSLNYFNRSFDKVIIGRVLGMDALGYYTRAYLLLNTGNTAIGGIISPVLHSRMVHSKGDEVALRRLFEAVTLLALWTVSPCMAILAAFPSDVLRIVWGPGWDLAADPLFWLGLAGMHQAVFSTMGVVFYTKQQTKALYIIGSVTTFLFVGSFFIGVSGGISGLAAAYSITSHFVFIIMFGYVWIKLLGNNAIRFVKVVIPPQIFGWALVCYAKFFRETTVGYDFFWEVNNQIFLSAWLLLWLVLWMKNNIGLLSYLSPGSVAT